MAKKLTDVAVKTLAPRRAAFIVWDANTTGLGFKVTPSNKRVWLAQLKFPGHRVQTRRSIGIYPAMGLAEARAKAAHWYALTKSGTDPAEIEAEERRKAEAARLAAARKQKDTFGNFAEDYIASRSNRRAKDDAQEIRRMLIPAWGTKALHDITPRDVRETFDRLKRRSAYDSRNAWSHAVSIFKQAVHQEVISVSPCASLDRKLVFAGVTITHRQRVLNDDEIFAFWRATDRLGFPAGPFYRLMLLTACRHSEIAEARWSELHPELRRLMRDAKAQDRSVDWAQVPPEVKVLVVPRERFKSDAEHRVALTDDALAILESLPRLAKSDYFFSLNGKGSVWIGDKFKKRLDAEMLVELREMARERGDDLDAVKLAGWVTHDLRRVVRTNLSALAVEDHVAEMVLGHARQGLQRIYDQHRYETQIRDALTGWAERLRTIVNPAPAAPPTGANNVVALKRRAGR